MAWLCGIKVNFLDLVELDLDPPSATGLVETP